MQVRVINNDINSALKKLKKKMFNEGIIKELMERRAYEKPSERKRRLKKESIRRVRKEAKRFEDE